MHYILLYTYVVKTIIRRGTQCVRRENFHRPRVIVRLLRIYTDDVNGFSAEGWYILYICIPLQQYI